MRLLLFFILFIISCCPLNKMSRKIRTESSKQYTGAVLIAKATEPIHFYFAFQKDNHFILSHRPKDLKPCSQDYYAGFYQKKTDTIYLLFTREFKPIQMENYLVYDSQNQVLFYPFKDKSRKLKVNIIYKDRNKDL